MLREPYSAVAVYQQAVWYRYRIDLGRGLVGGIADYLLGRGVEFYNPVSTVISHPHDSLWCDRDSDRGTNILRRVYGGKMVLGELFRLQVEPSNRLVVGLGKPQRSMTIECKIRRARKLRGNNILLKFTGERIVRTYPIP